MLLFYGYILDSLRVSLLLMLLFTEYIPEILRVSLFLMVLLNRYIIAIMVNIINHYYQYYYSTDIFQPMQSKVSLLLMILFNGYIIAIMDKIIIINIIIQRIYSSQCSLKYHYYQCYYYQCYYLTGKFQPSWTKLLLSILLFNGNILASAV